MATDKETPVKNEALDVDTTVVRWSDRDWTIPASVDDWDMETLEAYETNRDLGFLRGVLGEKQFAEFRKAAPRVKQMKEFGAIIGDAMGMSPGE